MPDLKDPGPSRRAILGVAAGGMAVGTIGFTESARPSASPEPPSAAADAYEETAHILAAYERMRF